MYYQSTNAPTYIDVVPTYQPTHIPKFNTYLSTYILPTFLDVLPTYPPTYNLPTYLPIHPPT
jgi:hypothetical protein